MNETWQRGVLFAAAAWNAIGGGLALAAAPQQAAWIAVIAWAPAYAGAALVPAARTVVLLAGAAGKLAYLAYCVALYRAGSIDGVTLAASSLDLVFVALFPAIVFAPQPKLSRPRAA
jgi:hypothetical protein